MKKFLMSFFQPLGVNIRWYADFGLYNINRKTIAKIKLLPSTFEITIINKEHGEVHQQTFPFSHYLENKGNFVVVHYNFVKEEWEPFEPNNLKELRLAIFNFIETFDF